MPAGNAYPSGHLVPSPILGLANAPIVETKFLELAMSLLDFSPRIPLGTFSILLAVHRFAYFSADLHVRRSTTYLLIPLRAEMCIRPSTEIANVVCLLPTSAPTPSSILLSSSVFSTDRLQVSLGLPLFLLPAGVHRKPTLGIAVSFILLTCPIQCHIIRLISTDSGVVPVIWWSSVLEMVFCKQIPRIRRRHLR